MSHSAVLPDGVEKTLCELLHCESVSRETLARLKTYHDLLVQWQSRINLISPTTVGEIWERHILDSVQVFALCQNCEGQAHHIDIGSGAGFPGLISAILMAENDGGRVDLIESSGKKCAFLRAVVRETGLQSSNVTVHVHNGRIENELSALPKPDFITARALASLNNLLGLTEGFLGDGSVGLFPKGRDHPAEVAEAEGNWEFLLKKTPSLFGDSSVLLEISDLKRL